MSEFQERKITVFVCARATLPCRIGLGEQPTVGFSNPSKAQRAFELLAVTRYTGGDRICVVVRSSMRDGRAGCGCSWRQAQPAGLSFSHPPHHESSWFSFLYCLLNIAARGARVVVDSTLPLVLCQAAFFMCHANRCHLGRDGTVSCEQEHVGPAC